jgi:hypothetical protein
VAPKANVDDMLFSGSLEALWPELGADQNVYVMDNLDDFLLQPGDAEKILANFGERAVIYPRGGHVGNLWFDDNRQWIINHIQPAQSSQ